MEQTKKPIKYPIMGANLRWLRDSNKLTQEEISERLNVKRTAYVMWEGGKSRPNPVDESNIVNFYHITRDALHGEDLSKALPEKGNEQKETPDNAGVNEWKDKYIASLERQAQAEREAKQEAIEAKLAEREAKEAYKEIARLKEATAKEYVTKERFARAEIRTEVFRGYILPLVAKHEKVPLKKLKDELDIRIEDGLQQYMQGISAAEGILNKQGT